MFFSVLYVYSQLRNHYDGQADPRGGRGRGRGGPSSSASSGANHPDDKGAHHPHNRAGRGVPAVLPEFSPVTEHSDLPPHSSGHHAEDPKVTSTVTSTANTTGLSANPLTSKLPSVLTDATGGLMQKFSDMTHNIGGGGAAAGAEGGGEGSILSKGKDLIFKRFGL